MARRSSLKVQRGTTIGGSIRPEQVVAPDAVPELLIDGVSNVAVVNGVARLSCIAIRAVPGGQTQTVQLVLRLAMAVPTLIGVNRAISQVIRQIEESSSGRSEKTT